MKKILIAIISVLMFTSAISAQEASRENYGENVSDEAPSLVMPFGTNVPSTSKVYQLGTYSGNIVYIGSILYTDKWLKKSGTTITFSSNFSWFRTQEDATNNVNQITSKAEMIVAVHTADTGSYKTYSSCTVNPGSSTQTCSLSIPNNEEFYIELCVFGTGLFANGSFTIK